MLVVALVCELHKADWQQLLLHDGHTPYVKLWSAVQQVQDLEMKSFLDELLKRASL